MKEKKIRKEELDDQGSCRDETFENLCCEQKSSIKGYRNRKFSAKGIKNSCRKVCFSDINGVTCRNTSFL